jgi:branched-chain amino acid transport system permease protein
MSLFVQRMFDGLAEGSIYALLALALVVIFRSTGQLNFAQGEIGTLCAFFASTLTLAGLPVWLSILIVMAIGFAIAAFVERVVVRPIEHRNPGAVIVALIGVFLAVNQLGAMFWGVDSRNLPSVFPTGSDDFYRIPGLDAAIRIERLGIIGVLIVMVFLLYVLFNKTKIGLAMRAVANNQESSNLVGIRVGNVLLLGWGLAGAIGALAAVLLAPSAGLTGTLMLGPFLLASVAAVLGGLDSPVGAVVGGLIIGLTKAFLIGYVDFLANMLFPVMLVILIGVLLVRPAGLFGSEKVVRV